MSFQDELRDKITEKIVAKLEAGTLPWRKPFTGGGMPTNVASKKYYRGINTVILAIHQMTHNLASGVYGTYKQWKDAGCQVRKRPEGVEEYGAGIVFFQPIKVKKVKDGVEKESTFPLMKAYTVFNAEQVDGGMEYLAKREKPVERVECEIHTEADKIIADYLNVEGIELKESVQAAYSPTLDVVMMPAREKFLLGTNSYYGTFFHELAHSTGHDKRLNRLEKFARFGSQSYAMEELVAEMAGCFMLGAVGLPVLNQLENHASYLASWLTVLKQDSKAIFTAAAAASAAADRILKQAAEEMAEAA